VNKKHFKEIVDYIKRLYPKQNPVPLHAPVFIGDEKKYLIDCINSTFVSYLGKYVNEFEELIESFTKAKYAIAVVNGTAALQIALQVAGVKPGEEVLTQPLTFVATANAISHCGAFPVFIDVDLDTMGMSPEKLDAWLRENVKYDKEGKKILNKFTNRRISAIVPMHTFGFPCRIDEIIDISNRYNIPVIEDSAESLGSFYKNKHTGIFGLAGIFSFNGNKIITTGGGGMIVTNDQKFAEKVAKITTTAKIPHKYEYIHDEIAYNYRMPNVNAAIGAAQMKMLNRFLENKRTTVELYRNFFNKINIKFFSEPKNSNSNYWLNAILFDNLEERNKFLNYSIDNGVITRPIWRLMNKLKMYRNCQKGNLDNAKWLEQRVVNIPSGVRINDLKI